MKQCNSSRSSKRNALALMLFVGLFSGSVGSNTDSEVHAISVLSNSDGSLYIDGNGELDALTDGLLILRSMFELSGGQLIQGSIGDDAIYTDSKKPQKTLAFGALLNSNYQVLFGCFDVDRRIHSIV